MSSIFKICGNNALMCDIEDEEITLSPPKTKILLTKFSEKNFSVAEENLLPSNRIIGFLFFLAYAAAESASG